MPWLILALAVLYFVAAWNGEASIQQLNANFGQDLPGFGKFALMVVVIWAIGMAPKMRRPATFLLALILVSIALTNSGGFFSNLTALAQGGLSTATGPVNVAPSQVSAGNVNQGSIDGGYAQAPAGSGYSSGLPSYGGSLGASNPATVQ